MFFILWFEINFFLGHWHVSIQWNEINDVISFSKFVMRVILIEAIQNNENLKNMTAGKFNEIIINYFFDSLKCT